MKVAEQNSGLRTGDDEYNKHQEQETKHVICLLRPEIRNGLNLQ